MRVAEPDAAGDVVPDVTSLPDDAHALVAAVRAAAQRHGLTWEALVPDAATINRQAEAAEERAYADMAAAKQRLRDHICRSYGITMDELNGLASA